MSDALPIIRVIVQRSSGDCAIATLAMYLGVNYEDILSVASQTVNRPLLHRAGMWTKDIKATAGALGVSLKMRRTFDPEMADGILVMKEHVAILRDGIVIDPSDGTIWDADVYISQSDKVTGLLTKE